MAQPASPSDAEAIFEAYRAAKAKHDAAVAALEAAAAGAASSPDPELIRRQAEAAVEEIEALSAVRALARPPMKPDVA